MKLDYVKGKKVLITGHDGFKGTWLVGILEKLNCKILGLSDHLCENRFFFESNNFNIDEKRSCITDLNNVSQIIHDFQPEIVIHMAAQPLVRRSYFEPIKTWQDNVTGTLNILEACRSLDITPKILVVTTDKVYKNNNWGWGYRENDELGGQDPYSASKSACEILINSYRKSYENLNEIIVVRGGNVIGGGDMSKDRLMPDIYRNFMDSQITKIRSPYATRPWQHVLDCLGGYLTILNTHLKNNKNLNFEYNIGPNLNSNKTVIEFVNTVKCFHDIRYKVFAEDTHLKESNFLYLDSSRASHECGWTPSINFKRGVALSCEWYFSDEILRPKIFLRQINDFLDDC